MSEEQEIDRVRKLLTGFVKGRAEDATLTLGLHWPVEKPGDACFACLLGMVTLGEPGTPYSFVGIAADVLGIGLDNASAIEHGFEGKENRFDLTPWVKLGREFRQYAVDMGEQE